MIGDWLAHIPVLAMAIAVIFGPGLLVGAGLRLRGLTLAAVAPGVSIGMLAVLALVFPYIGVTWGLLSVSISVALIAGVVWLGRRLWGAPPPRTVDQRARMLLIAGLIVGAGLIVARMLTYIGLPWAISQTNDAVFHFNALRWISEIGSASSLDLTGVIGGTSFYPAAWHAVVSLTALSPESLPIAVNMVALVIAAGIWPLGIAVFTRVVTGGSTLAAALAAALSGALLAFPQLMFEWGVLYPYALSVALVPATVAATMLVAHPRGAGTSMPSATRSAVPVALAALMGVVAIALAQPASLLVWGLLVAVWASGLLIIGLRRGDQAGDTRRRVTAGVALVAMWAGLALVWVQLAVLAGPVLWDPYRSIPRAVVDVLLNSQGALPPAVGMSALLITGLVVAVRTPRWRWLAASWTILAILFIVSVATNLPLIKRALTGPWYGDSYRLAALAPIAVLPLAAIGLAAILVWFARSIQSTHPQRWFGAWAIGVIALIGVVGVAVAPIVQLRVAEDRDEQSRYALNDRSYLSRDAFLLLQRLPDTVPEDALLIGNPSTGVGFAYSLGQRDVVPRTWAPPIAEAWDLLATDLRDAGDNAEVCEALALFGAPGYVLDFGEGDTTPGRYEMPGMTDFEGRAGFELVDQVGDASLWRITACR